MDEKYGKMLKCRIFSAFAMNIMKVFEGMLLRAE
jgi:hypothetical protein